MSGINTCGLDHYLDVRPGSNIVPLQRLISRCSKRDEGRRIMEQKTLYLAVDPHIACVSSG